MGDRKIIYWSLALFFGCSIVFAAIDSAASGSGKGVSLGDPGRGARGDHRRDPRDLAAQVEIGLTGMVSECILTPAHDARLHHPAHPLDR